jgi:alpha-glucosidase (family GH31 glycosyl hydrolase)
MARPLRIEIPGGRYHVTARESARTGEPIVRPLDFDYPGQGSGMITDELLLGRSILVAPVLKKGGTKRNIHFPPGAWCMARAWWK